MLSKTYQKQICLTQIFFNHSEENLKTIASSFEPSAYDLSPFLSRLNHY